MWKHPSQTLASDTGQIYAIPLNIYHHNYATKMHYYFLTNIKV